MKTKINLIIKTVLIALLTGVVSGFAVAAPTQVATFQANGGYANAYFYTSDGGWGNLSTSQSNPKGARNTQTFLNYNASKCTGDWWSGYSCTSSWGYGLIPNSAFQQTANKQLSLNYDTNSNPDFPHGSSTETCTIVWDPDGWWGWYECTYSSDAPGNGVITMTWTPNPYYKSTWAGSNSNTYGRYTNRVAGQSTSSSASVSGGFFGSDLVDWSGGDVGKYHNTSISIFKNR